MWQVLVIIHWVQKQEDYLQNSCVAVRVWLYSAQLRSPGIHCSDAVFQNVRLPCTVTVRHRARAKKR
jgi:hypothetical protein